MAEAGGFPSASAGAIRFRHYRRRKRRLNAFASLFGQRNQTHGIDIEDVTSENETASYHVATGEPQGTRRRVPKKFYDDRYPEVPPVHKSKKKKHKRSNHSKDVDDGSNTKKTGHEESDEKTKEEKRRSREEKRQKAAEEKEKRAEKTKLLLERIKINNAIKSPGSGEEREDKDLNLEMEVNDNAEGEDNGPILEMEVNENRERETLTFEPNTDEGPGDSPPDEEEKLSAGEEPRNSSMLEEKAKGSESGLNDNRTEGSEVNDPMAKLQGKVDKFRTKYRNAKQQLANVNKELVQERLKNEKLEAEMETLETKFNKSLRQIEKLNFKLGKKQEDESVGLPKPEMTTVNPNEMFNFFQNDKNVVELWEGSKVYIPASVREKYLHGERICSANVLACNLLVIIMKWSFLKVCTVKGTGKNGVGIPAAVRKAIFDFIKHYQEIRLVPEPNRISSADKLIPAYTSKLSRIRRGKNTPPKLPSA